MKGWLDKYQEEGKVFLQPNSKKLPRGYKVPLKDDSSELAMSIGGEQGEPAYLIPSFKYGKPLLNPLEEYRKTGEHLGGPFKTWQEADKWEREIRHPYVEKGQPIPSPLKYWGEGFQEGGTIPKAQKGIIFPQQLQQINNIYPPEQTYLSSTPYRTPEAEHALRRERQYQNVARSLHDIGTGLLTWGTMFSPPSQKQLEAGREGWGERLPMIGEQAATAAMYNMVPQLAMGAISGVKNIPVAYRNLVEAARVNDFTSLNPWAKKLDPSMGYAPVSLNKAQRMMESGLIYRGTKPGEAVHYIPIVNKEGRTTQYVPRFEKQIYKRRKIGDNDIVTVTFSNGRQIKVPASDVKAGKFKKYNRVKFSIGDNTFTKIDDKTTIPTVKYSGKSSPDIKFKIGDVPDYSMFGITDDFILQADPSKMALVKGPYKSVKSLIKGNAGYPFTPDVSKTLKPGDWGIPLRSITSGEYSTLGAGNKLLMKDPIWGYREVVDPDKLAAPSRKLSDFILNKIDKPVQKISRKAEDISKLNIDVIKNYYKARSEPLPRVLAGDNWDKIDDETFEKLSKLRKIMSVVETSNTLDVKKLNNLISNSSLSVDELIPIYKHARQNGLNFLNIINSNKLNLAKNQTTLFTPTNRFAIDLSNDPNFRRIYDNRIGKIIEKKSIPFIDTNNIPVNDLIGSLFRSSTPNTNNAIFDAIKIIDAAPSNTVFRASGSLSPESFVAGVNKALEKFKGSGYQFYRGPITSINTLDDFSKLGVNPEHIATYMNQYLRRINIGGKQFPAATIDDAGNLVVPQFILKKLREGGIIPKAQEGRILEREGMRESPFSFLIPEKSGSGTGRTSKYFTELSNYYKGDASYPYQYLYESEYKPTMGLGEDVQYMSIQDDLFKQRIVEEFNKGKKKGNKVNVSYAKDLDPLGKFSVYKGSDDKGDYLSYYDKWDVNPLADMIGKPFELYDRIYVEKNAEGKYVPKKFAEGGNVSYTPEYIEQLKRFENRSDNLAYHLDDKKIPTIGWGHRITEEELKRKAIKMGKEWVPYEKFSGKEGRQYADRLMELDVAHHYNRLERQVGRDTLTTLPPEVHDVLLDITYNRGSLGDSLEYVKKGDIPGLKNYLADVSKGLKGGAKTRMEWRANRIPLTTPAPVQVPLYDTPQNNYVPEVLQNIVQDNEGYRNPENYGKPVQIVSNQSTTPISMQGVPFPILAMSDTGELKIMFPGEEHTFEGGSVTELPMAKKGGKYQKGGEIDPVLNEVKDAYNFIKSYHDSPKFEERYRNMYANDLRYNTKHADYFIDYYSNIIPTTQNPQFKEQYEDQLRFYQKVRDKSLKKLDEKVNFGVSTARNKLKDLSFFTLRGEKRQPWSDRIIRSFKGRPNPEGVETGSHYNTANNIAFIYKDQLKDEYGNPGSIAAHEFSHAVSSHIPYSIDMILKQSKMLTNHRDEHDVAFDETKSDIDALRYLLNKNKIYDTRTQDFTKEHLQRAKKTIKDFSFDRLQRLYNDDDLIELMNIIAANDNDKKEPVTIAKKGAVVKSNQLRTFTEDNGWLNKYKEQ